MRYSYPQEVLQEVPGEISLALSISGCPLRCLGCHSQETQDPFFGEILDKKEFKRLLQKHYHISCVLFYGGDWDLLALIPLIKIAKQSQVKVALYSGFGLTSISFRILDLLDYLKIGPYIAELGGIEMKTSNQKMYSINKGILLDITHQMILT